MKQAKIAIGLDIKPAKAEVGKLKDVFKALGNDLKNVFSKDLHDQVKIFENLIGNCTDRLHDLHRASQQALNPKVISNYVDQYRALSSVIGRVARQQQAFGRNVVVNYPQTQGAPAYTPAPAAPQPSYTQPTRSGGGGGGGGGDGSEMSAGGGLSSLVKGASKMLGAVGIGFGLHAAIERELEHAEAGIRVRELTGGGIVSGRSRFGFTRMERLQRAGAIAGEAGRDLSGGEINGLVNQSEMLQRGFGITGEGFSGAVGAFRRAGSERPGDSIATAIGDAVSIKLSGSAVGEYLQQMAGYLDQISKGVNVDEKSLRGFATSIGGLDFFRGHPERIFDMLGKLDSLFKGGGSEYQNFGIYRATQEVAARRGQPLSPSGVANRRAFGLFGNSGATLRGFSKAGMSRLAKELGGGGDDEIRQFLSDAFRDATQGGRSADSQEAFQLFRETTGLEAGQAASVYQTLGKGGKLNGGQLQAFKNAQKTPQERSEETMKSYEGAVKAFGEDVDNIKNIVSENIMTAALKMDDAATKFSDAVMKYIAKAFGEGEKAPYNDAAEAFTKGATTHGFAPSVDDATSYAQSEADSMPLMRAIHSKQFNSPYDKLNDDQKAKVDRDVQAHLERSRAAQLHKEAEHIQAYQRYLEMGKDFDPKTAAEKDVASDAADLSAEDLAAKYSRTITNQRKFDAFINGDEDDDSPATSRITPTAKARGGFVGFADGGERKYADTVEGGAISSAGNKRAAAFFSSLWEMITGSGSAKADTDPYENLAKHAGYKGERHAGGGTVGFSTIRGIGRGSSRMGTDTLLTTAVTPGEFVVNARDASRNMLALQHANAGGRIRPYADGGSVGNDSSSSDDDSLTPSKATPMANVKLDFGKHGQFLDANTRALFALAQVLSGGAQMRDVPRGPRMKYG